MRHLRRFVVLLAVLIVITACLVGRDTALAQQAGGAASPPATAAPTAPAATTAPDPAAPSLPPEALEPVQRLARNIENAEKSIQQLKELESELARLRTEVERIIYDSTSTAETLRPQLEEVEKQIERLGPPPTKDQPAESATVAAERARLAAQKAALDGAIKTTELAWVRAKQLIDRITVIRYQLFTRNLFERRDSPLLPSVWQNVASQWSTIIGRLQYYGNDWLTWASRKQGSLWALGGAALAIFGALTWLTRRTIAPHLVRPEPPAPFFRRAMQAAWMAPLRMVAPAVVVLVIYFGLAGLDLLFAPWVALANATLAALLVFIASRALLKVCLAPRTPAWRLIPVDDQTARRILRLLELFVAIYLFDSVLVELARILYVPLSVTVVKAFATSVAFALLLLVLALTPFVPLTGPDRPVNGHAYVPKPVTLLSPLWIKLPLLATAAMIIVPSLLGYVALGRFVAHQVVLSGTVLAACGLFYLAVRAVTRGRADNSDVVSGFLERTVGLTDARRKRQISMLVEAFATLAIGVLALPVLLLQWGFSGADIRDWWKALLFGFEIGQFRISLARILIAIALFTALLFLTRIFQKWLRENVLTGARMDVGIANSIDTSIGYAGIGLAILLALSYAGLDITSLAIVAGALSVGIGFGLQSIVNNFVSGLILLVERPIKVGDWIVVGNEQGNVRRISVRSTEIETFDRASLIVPNSELITGRVLNWTHRNPMGRAVVKVRVSSTADPDRVLAILRDISGAHPDALKTPAPFITCDDFSANGIDFTIRVVVADVYTSGRVASEIRIALMKAFREAGLLETTSQVDVHLRDLDWIKAAAARVAEKPSASAARQSQPDDAGDNR